MPKSFKQLADEGKPFPLTWKERIQNAGAVAYVVFLVIPLFLYLLYCAFVLLFG